MSDSFDEDDFLNDPETLAQVDIAEQEHIQATQHQATGWGLSTSTQAASGRSAKTAMAVPAVFASKSAARNRFGSARVEAWQQSRRETTSRSTSEAPGRAAGAQSTSISNVNRPSTSNLAPRPLFASPAEDVIMRDVGSDEYPDISVTEDGKYEVVSAHRMNPAGDISIKPAEGIPTPQAKAPQPLPGRRPLFRSVSMNASQPLSQSSQRGGHRASQSTSVAYPAPQGAVAGRTFTRTLSVGEERRRAAIEQSLGMEPSASQVRRFQVENVGAVIPAVPEMPSGQDESGSSRTVAQDDVVRTELETMRKRLEELAAERERAEDKARQAQNEIYRFKGEAEHVRRKLEEQEKNHQVAAQTMRAKMEELQNNINQEKLNHRRQLESVQTEHVFKTHNLVNSASKPRFLSSQRPTASQAARATPTRHHTMMEGFGGGMLPIVTPSKSPTSKKSKRTQSMAVEMGAKNDPAFAGFATPMVPYKKAKRTPKETAEIPVDTPAFKGLHNSFAVDSAIAANRHNRPLKDVQTDDDTQTPSKPSTVRAPVAGPESSSPSCEMEVEIGWDGGDVPFQEEEGGDPYCRPQAGDEDLQSIFMDRHLFEHNSAAVLRILLTHTSSRPSFTSHEPPLPTIQKILNFRPQEDDDKHHYRQLTVTCAHILAGFSHFTETRSDPCDDNLRYWWLILTQVAKLKESYAQLDVIESILSLLTDIAQRIPGYLTNISATRMAELGEWVVALVGKFLPAPSPAPISSKGRTTEKANRGKARPSAEKQVGEAVPPIQPSLAPQTSEMTELRSQLGQSLCRFIAAHAWEDRALLEDMAIFVNHPTGLPLLLQPHQPFDLVQEAVETTSLLCCHKGLFRKFLSAPSSDEQPDITRMPVIDVLCRYLIGRHPEAESVKETTLMRLKIVNILSMIAAQHHDAVLLLGESYYLVPTLVKALEREAEVIWGLTDNEEGMTGPFTLVIGIITLLHFLVFPPPSLKGQNGPLGVEGESPTGIDLLSKLRSSLSNQAVPASRHEAAKEFAKEFNGLHHMFIVAIGRISYAELDLAALQGGWGEDEVRALQYLAQDLLESVVEGPEGDSIYEVYVVPEDADNDNDVEGAAAAEEEQQVVDEDQRSKPPSDPEAMVIDMD